MAALLVAAAARGGDPLAGAAELEAESAELEQRARTAELELFALESRLARASDRVAELYARLAALDEEQATAQRLAEVARTAYKKAQERLAARLRALYVEGEVDPVAVLLGARSLDEVASALDSLERIAAADASIAESAQRTRAELRRATAELARREARVRTLTADAQEARDALAAAVAERRSFLAELRQRQRLSAREIDRLVAAASAAERKAEELTDAATQGASTSTAAEAAATPAAEQPPALPVGPGTTLTVMSTAYALPGTTATGVPVGPGIVAVDPSVIPLGTEMWIPGYGWGVAADTGGAIKGLRIDVWVPTEADAIAWGWREVEITIY